MPTSTPEKKKSKVSDDPFVTPEPSVSPVKGKRVNRRVKRQEQLDTSDSDDAVDTSKKKRCKYVDDEAEEDNDSQSDNNSEIHTEDDSVVEVESQAEGAVSSTVEQTAGDHVPLEDKEGTEEKDLKKNNSMSGKSGGSGDDTLAQLPVETMAMLLEIARSQASDSVKTSTFAACFATTVGTLTLNILSDVPEWDDISKMFTAVPDWACVAACLMNNSGTRTMKTWGDYQAKSGAGVTDQSKTDAAAGSGKQLEQQLSGQALTRTLDAKQAPEFDPVPKEKLPTSVQLKPKLKTSDGGLGHVVIVTALSHCMYAVQFVERVNGVDKSVFSGTRQHPGTIGCALSCMTPSWYKCRTRLGVRGDATNQDEWFWYRSWLELTTENMDKLVELLKKNMAEGAAQVKKSKTPTKDWQDKRNRDTWLKSWSFEVSNRFDEKTKTYEPKPWDVLFPNSQIRSLTSGRFSVFDGYSVDELVAAGGFFSKNSPYNLKMVIDGEDADGGESAEKGLQHIAFSDEV